MSFEAMLRARGVTLGETKAEKATMLFLNLQQAFNRFQNGQARGDVQEVREMWAMMKYFSQGLYEITSTAPPDPEKPLNTEFEKSQ